ncbi:hypothetical protein ACSLMH_11780 [Flavobacterium columnare]|uniref:hypothetical protein n=1 Tax=Flavobacterium columnare TaxID=996 RepID=UPI004033AD0A
MEYFVIGLFVFVIAIFICAFNIILLKKEIFYNYICKEKKISNFDYLMDFDGNWLFKEIDMNDIPEDERNEKSLLEKLDRILKCNSHYFT